MIYVMECNGCGAKSTIECRMSEHERLVKPGFDCRCGGRVVQIIERSGADFVRSAFPKGDPRWEHVSNEPVYVKDKKHLKDLCEENGNTSRYLEDAV